MSSYLKNIHEGIKTRGNLEKLQVRYTRTNEVYNMAESFGLGLCRGGICRQVLRTSYRRRRILPTLRLITSTKKKSSRTYRNNLRDQSTGLDGPSMLYITGFGYVYLVTDALLSGRCRTHGVWSAFACLEPALANHRNIIKYWRSQKNINLYCVLRFHKSNNPILQNLGSNSVGRFHPVRVTRTEIRLNQW